MQKPEQRKDKESEIEVLLSKPSRMEGEIREHRQTVKRRVLCRLLRSFIKWDEARRDTWQHMQRCQKTREQTYSMVTSRDRVSKCVCVLWKEQLES